MINLTSQRLRLRALEADDLTYFMAVENDSSMWNVCDTRVPFSRYALERILETSAPDIYAEKQLRLVICLKEKNDTPVGFVDFYDFSPLHHRAGVGVVIYPASERNKNYAREALTLALDYAFQSFDLHQIWAEMSQDNTASIRLFESLGMTHAHVRPQWLYINGAYRDVHVYHVLKEDFLSHINK